MKTGDTVYINVFYKYVSISTERTNVLEKERGNRGIT